MTDNPLDPLLALIEKYRKRRENWRGASDDPNGNSYARGHFLQAADIVDDLEELRAANARGDGSENAIKLLVAAGFVTQAKADEALKIVREAGQPYTPSPGSEVKP